MRHVALLRGINVGGKRTIPMTELAALFAKAGARDVTTYIQSGNVVFTGDGAKVARAAAAAIAKRYGFEVPVITRSAAQLREVVTKNPFAREPTKALHVAFLADAPAAATAAKLDPARGGTDRFALVGRDIYLCCPDGLARTKLSNSYFDTTLATTSTLRNWNTVLALIERLGEGSLRSS
jgi:uncharacterized protein (DUF1697 family)